MSYHNAMRCSCFFFLFLSASSILSVSWLICNSKYWTQCTSCTLHCTLENLHTWRNEIKWCRISGNLNPCIHWLQNIHIWLFDYFSQCHNQISSSVSRFKSNRFGLSSSSISSHRMILILGKEAFTKLKLKFWHFLASTGAQGVKMCECLSIRLCVIFLK